MTNIPLTPYFLLKENKKPQWLKYSPEHLALIELANELEVTTMDKPLFTQLFEEIDKLIELLELAPTRISESGIKNNKPSQQDLEQWNILIEKVKTSNNQLKQLVDNDFTNSLVKIKVVV